jgi:hypothetical protein
MAILPLVFILEAIIDAFHIEVFGIVILQIEFAIMAPPVEVDVGGFGPE